MEMAMVERHSTNQLNNISSPNQDDNASSQLSGMNSIAQIEAQLNSIGSPSQINSSNSLSQLGNFGSQLENFSSSTSLSSFKSPSQHLSSISVQLDQFKSSNLYNPGRLSESQNQQNEDELSFTSTERNHRKACYRGYYYTCQRTSQTSGMSFWICEDYFKTKCKGRIHVLDDRSVTKECEHMHPPNYHRASVLKAISKAREMASSSNIDAHNVVALATSTLSSEEIQHLPSHASLKRSIQRKRHKLADAEKMPSSVVWDYFKVQDPNDLFACCTLCQRLIKRGANKKTFSTSPMHKHLETHHPDMYAVAQVKAKALIAEKKFQQPVTPYTSSAPASQKEKPPRQPKPTPVPKEVMWKNIINGIANNASRTAFTPSPTQKPNPEQLVRKIFKFLALDNQPLALIEGQGFRQLINHISPDFSMPNAGYMNETMLPRVYLELEADITSDIERAQYISFASNRWHNAHDFKLYHTIHAQWLTDDFVPLQRVVYLQEIENNSEYEAMKSFWEMARRWDMRMGQLHVLVDSEQNFMHNQACVETVPCLAKYLEMTWRDAIANDEVANRVFSKALRFMGEVPLPGTSFISACYSALSKSSTNTVEHHTTLPTMHNMSMAYTAEECVIRTQLVAMIEPFVFVLTKLNEPMSLLSSSMPHLIAIARFLQSTTIDQALAGLMTRLRSAVEGLLNNRVMTITTVVDPRYKLEVFEDRERVKKWLVEAIEQQSPHHDKDNEEGENDEEEGSNKDEQKHLAGFLRFYSCAEEGSEPASKRSRLAQSFHSEVESFLSEPGIDKWYASGDALAWWSRNKRAYPNVARLARKLLAAPAISRDWQSRYVTQVRLDDVEARRKMLFVYHNLLIDQSARHSS